MERDGTACWVPATPTHSTFHASAADDDYVLSDWWRLAKATKEIFMVPLDCLGKTSNTCQYTGEPSARGSKGLSTFSYSAFQFRGRRRQNKTYTILPEDTRRRLQDAPVARVRRSPIPRRRSGPSARGGRGRDHGRAPDGPDGGPDVSDGPLKACPPLVLKAPLHGFGNVIEQMMGGYERARNCGHAGLQLITADELAADIPAGQKRFGPPDRYRRICERLGCENATLVFRGADIPQTCRGGVAGATRIFRGDGSRRRRGRDVDNLWRRVAAASRLRRGHSVETRRGAAATWKWTPQVRFAGARP